MRKSTTAATAPKAPPTSAGRVRQKGRTRAALLTAARTLIASGLTPSVADVADAADVSRRTAYRYFATQEQLLVEAALEGLRPRIEQEITAGASAASPDEGPHQTVGERLDRTARALQRNAVANEALLRTMIRLTVGPFTAPVDEETAAAPLRRGYRRIEWIELALAPAKAALGKRRHRRLVEALTVCLGIDALVVLEDLCGLSAARAEAVSRWMAQALLAASLEEAGE